MECHSCGTAGGGCATFRDDLLGRIDVERRLALGIPVLACPLLVHDSRRFPGDELPEPVFFSHAVIVPDAFPCVPWRRPAIPLSAAD